MGLIAEKKEYEYEKNVDIHQKKHMYSFLNRLGVFIFIGWGFMIFTVPLDLNQNGEWVYVKGIHLNGEMILEFFLCLITVGILYFGLLYLYFNKTWGKPIVFISLLCLGISDGILFFLVL